MSLPPVRLGAIKSPDQQALLSQHRARQLMIGHRGLIGAIGTCSLGVHDYPELVINEIVRIVGEERGCALPGNPGCLWVGE